MLPFVSLYIGLSFIRYLQTAFEVINCVRLNLLVQVLINFINVEVHWPVFFFVGL
jgi:hypothetical protein